MNPFASFAVTSNSQGQSQQGLPYYGTAPFLYQYPGFAHNLNGNAAPAPIQPPPTPELPSISTSFATQAPCLTAYGYNNYFNYYLVGNNPGVATTAIATPTATTTAAQNSSSGQQVGDRVEGRRDQGHAKVSKVEAQVQTEPETQQKKNEIATQTEASTDRVGIVIGTVTKMEAGEKFGVISDRIQFQKSLLQDSFAPLKIGDKVVVELVFGACDKTSDDNGANNFQVTKVSKVNLDLSNIAPIVTPLPLPTQTPKVLDIGAVKMTPKLTENLNSRIFPLPERIPRSRPSGFFSSSTNPNTFKNSQASPSSSSLPPTSFTSVRRVVFDEIGTTADNFRQPPPPSPPLTARPQTHPSPFPSTQTPAPPKESATPTTISLNKTVRNATPPSPSLSKKSNSERRHVAAHRFLEQFRRSQAEKSPLPDKENAVETNSENEFDIAKVKMEVIDEIVSLKLNDSQQEHDPASTVTATATSAETEIESAEDENRKTRKRRRPSKEEKSNVNVHPSLRRFLTDYETDNDL